MVEKPSEFPDWATEEQVDPVSGQTNRVAPPSESQESGWTRREIPPRQWWNWTLWTISRWLRWLDERENRPESYTVGTLPDASQEGEGKMVYVSDETGGAVIAFSDGTDWRRVTDREVVS